MFDIRHGSRPTSVRDSMFYVPYTRDPSASPRRAAAPWSLVPGPCCAVQAVLEHRR